MFVPFDNCGKNKIQNRIHSLIISMKMSNGGIDIETIHDDDDV